jgi:uncharacterized repeat protein (TIGR03806 family)
MRTRLAVPQGRRLLDANQNLTFLFNILNAVDSPAVAQHQNLLKHFLGYHSDSQFTKPFTHYKRRGTGYFFAFYTLNAFSSSQGKGLHQRVARFQATPPGGNQATLDSEVPLITQFDEASNHNGGDLHFGPDGFLYVSLGDEGDGNDALNNSQRIDKDFFSGILRLDVDNRPESVPPNAHPAVKAAVPRPYSIPADNPFIGATSFAGRNVNPKSVRTEFYAVGLRNPWRMSFDPATGRLYCGDVGQDAREEVDIIERGGNYGWAFREATITGPKPGEVPAGTPHIPPIHDYPHGSTGTNTGNCVIGGVVYRGARFPELYGFYIFADYGSGNVWALHYGDDRVVSGFRLLTVYRNIIAFGRDPRTGDVLFGATTGGKIRRLEVTAGTGGSPLPATLADTGAFTDLLSLDVAPGIVPFTVNQTFWSDGAEKQRWFSIPNPALAATFHAEGSWAFPTGTVWIKHFNLVTNEQTGARRRLETRFLVQNSAGVYGMTYRWAPGATNATLVAEEGSTEAIRILTTDGLVRTQQWIYPSRGGCLACHATGTGGPLGFNTAQLNCDLTYPTGIRTNQLLALAEAGYLTADPPSPASLRRLPAREDDTWSLESRVRGYLAANCSQCHRPGGPTTAAWDGRLETPTELAGLLNGPLNDSRGDAANRVVVPGDPGHSVLLQRIQMRGPGQMPPLGSTVVDSASVALVQAWIQSSSIRQRSSYDDWRQELFPVPDDPQGEPLADPDQDGSLNLQEYQAGTDPHDASDRLALTLTTGDQGAALAFRQPANRHVLVETTDDLQNPAAWQPTDLPSTPSADFPVSSVERSLLLPTTGGSARYYRIRAVAP